MKRGQIIAIKDNKILIMTITSTLIDTGTHREHIGSFAPDAFPQRL
jgi:hypothetical protein